MSTTDAAPVQHAPAENVRPWLTLWLLSAGHAVNHAQAALLPLVYLAIIVEFEVGVAAVAFLAAIGNISAGSLQIAYGWLTRLFSRRSIMAVGGLVFGGGMAAQALAPGFAAFAAANVVSRVGGSPQHPVGNGLLSEQFPPHRRGFAIAAHIAGGNLGTVAVPLVGLALIEAIGWRWTVVLFGLPAIVVALAIWRLIGESGVDRAAARAYGSVRSAYAAVLRDRDLLLVYASAVLGGGGRGLGVLNVFVPIYLSIGLGLDTPTVGLMYAVLVVGSVPGPIVAGWLSDRLGRRLLIVATYLAGAASLALFVLAGADLPMLWLAIVLMSIFNFVESPQLQALLADIASRDLRDAAFAAYFTLAFGIGSLWVLLYGAVIEGLGETAGLPLTFWLMALAFVAAAMAVLPIRVRERLAGAKAADAGHAS
ncbi:MAG TPA: MFS transporter [Candidatus Limnocylindrales bacterium]|jgi:MFS transporter, FSR family, fosmidomycin resistance protein|nr:MFS transporter [Candidatus Limnocylindrales bacterium]